MWRVVSTKIIFEHPRITLAEDEIELPNGHKTEYLRFVDNGGAGVTLIAIRDDGKILVEQEYSHPPQKWLYQFPGGGVPAGEDVARGANRELMEECNLKANNLTDIGSFLMNNRRSATSMHVFVAKNLIDEELSSDIEENIKLFWFTEQEIDRLIVGGEIENGPMLAAWALYKAWQQK